MRSNTILWFDRFVPLDDNVAGAGAQIFKLPPQEYLDFGDANQAYMTVEYWGVGPGAANTTLMFQRSATREDHDEVFEDMMTSSLAITRANAVHKVAFGADGGTNKYPRGIGRFVITNAGIAGDWSAVRLRISVTLVAG